ncbi:MAG TPA: GNAT family N-acetyltransferase [Solirubrobacterales bacterium]|nr:GNAT family N-acetyltransferase [Solirubrobacterales bacterium]
MVEVHGAFVCLFPAAPESGVYNNALLPRGLGPAAVAQVVDAVGEAYRAAGIGRFAVWAHESEPAAVIELENRGYRFDTSTRAMAMRLEDLRVEAPALELGELDWDGYVRTFGLPEGLLAGADAAEFRLRVARLDGRDVGAVLAYDHDGDCGIFNLGTLADARRRGIGTALTALALHEARARGCTTATLQSTEIAEGVYSVLGFGDLGRYLEYAAGRDQT